MLYQENYLAHHGIKDQRWGLRRFQNYDGSLTAEGRDRYGVGEGSSSNAHKKNEKKEKSEKRKRILAKIGKGLAITAATAAVGYGAHKAYQKSTNLRDQYRSMAESESRYHDYDKNYNAYRARREIDDAKIRRWKPEQDSYANKLRYEESMRSAHSFLSQAKRNQRLSKKYAEIARATTRTKAVANYIRNKGVLTLPDPRNL